jgi:hypothetical protein
VTPRQIFLLGFRKILPLAFTPTISGSHDSDMRIHRARLLILVSALIACGFCFGALVRSRTTGAGGAATTSITPAPGSSSARVPMSVLGPEELPPNLAAQKPGPLDSNAQRTAAASVESAARGATELAGK